MAMFRPLRPEEVEWRDVVGYEGLYSVSNDGRVFGVKSQRELKADLTHKRYLEVKLYKNGIGRMRKVHRLVADAFIENPEKKPQVNHKDGNRFNNNASNLEWVTQSENIRHAFDTGLNKPNLDSPIFKKTPVVAIDEDGREVMRFDGMMDAARELGLSVSNICNSCHGRIKRTGGYRWRLLSGR